MLSNSPAGGMSAAPQAVPAAKPQAGNSVPDEGYNPFADASVNPDAGSSSPEGKVVPAAPVQPAVPAPAPAPVEINTITGKPKRHRRTKAEMMAVRAEEARRKAELEAAEASVAAPAADIPSAPVSRIEGFGILGKLLAVRNEIGTVERDSVSDIVDDNGNQYRFRSLEGILSVLNPILYAHGLFITFEDEVLPKAPDYVYIRSRANLFDAETGEVFSTSGLAREDFSIGDKWASQITGSCSTYARKYALSAMFAFSSTRADDPDRDANARSRVPSAPLPAGKLLLAPGVSAWNSAVREASEWQGSVEDLEAAIRSRFDINEVNLAILLRKAGIIQPS